jgi:hypothetical protein
MTITYESVLVILYLLFFFEYQVNFLQNYFLAQVLHGVLQGREEDESPIVSLLFFFTRIVPSFGIPVVPVNLPVTQSCFIRKQNEEQVVLGIQNQPAINIITVLATLFHEFGHKKLCDIIPAYEFLHPKVRWMRERGPLYFYVYFLLSRSIFGDIGLVGYVCVGLYFLAALFILLNELGASSLSVFYYLRYFRPYHLGSYIGFLLTAFYSYFFLFSFHLTIMIFLVTS